MKTLSDDVSDRSRLCACLAFSTSGAFLALVALMHAIKRDLDPDWHVLSEYAIGSNGWIMSLAFLLWAASCTALGWCLKSHVTTRAGRIGIGLLAVAAFGLVLAAFATTDPITATGDQLTTHGKLHGFGAMLGIPGVLLASTLVTWDLRRNRAWRATHRWLTLTSAFAWAAAVINVVVIATMYDGAYGPDVKVGWPNRLIALAYCGWIMATASAARLTTTVPAGDASPRPTYASGAAR